MVDTSLEGILESKGLIKLDNKGKKSLVNKEKAWKTYIDYAKDIGFINRWILKGYTYVKKKNFHGPTDWFVQVYLGGTMTRRDQESFAFIAGKEPWKLTIYNSIMTSAMSPQYYGVIKGAGFVGSLFSGFEADSVDSFAIYLTGAVAVSNLMRGGVASYTKKAYAAISIDGLLINLPTYAKKISSKSPM